MYVLCVSVKWTLRGQPNVKFLNLLKTQLELEMRRPMQRCEQRKTRNNKYACRRRRVRLAQRCQLVSSPVMNKRPWTRDGGVAGTRPEGTRTAATGCASVGRALIALPLQVIMSLFSTARPAANDDGGTICGPGLNFKRFT